MIEEFSRIIAIAEKLNSNVMVLPETIIKEQKVNIVDFGDQKKKLINTLNKLANISQEFVEQTTPSKTPIVGKVSIVFMDIYHEIDDYRWQFDAMRDFLKPLVNIYKQKAQRVFCEKPFHKTNPILAHITNTKKLNSMPEIERLISLLALHNSYLEKKQILTIQEINIGIDIAKELSAMSKDIQEVLDKLEYIDIIDICRVDLLLRTLYGKIVMSAEYIHTIKLEIIRKMAGHYPDCDHVGDE